MISLREIYEIELWKLRPDLNKLSCRHVSVEQQKLKNRDSEYPFSKKEQDLKIYQKKFHSKNTFSKRV